jgi:DNA invertase Pin-like site-specific DNA recombinase
MPVQTVIYSRVSTYKQVQGTSLNSQVSICNDYCKSLKFKVINSIEEVCSSKSMSNQIKLNDIIMNNSNINLVILEPSRLSRNIKDFTSLLDKCDKQNIILHFVQNNTVSNNSQDIKKIISNVYDAELESKTLSQRIKQSITYKKKMKTYLPPIPSFGYMIQDKKLCLEKTEQNIIILINKLFWGSDTNSINQLLSNLTGNDEKIYDLYDNNEISEVRHGNMRIIDIVFFLNNLGITFRGRNWYTNSVSKLIKEKKFKN